jgi:hypothetical protein
VFYAIAFIGVDGNNLCFMLSHSLVRVVNMVCFMHSRLLVWIVNRCVFYAFSFIGEHSK